MKSNQFLKTSMSPVTWTETRSLRQAALRAGDLPGVYLIGGLDEIAGVPRAYDWVYVGRSKSLGRRLAEHLPAHELNPPLREWLQLVGAGLVVRFAVLPELETKRVEKELVRSLAPKHNRIMFTYGERNERFNQYA